MSGAPALPMRHGRSRTGARAAVLVGGIVVAVGAYVAAQRIQYAQRDAALAAADSIPDARDAGPGGDRARPMSLPVPVVITRAESLAIADAVTKRQAATATVPRSTAASATEAPVTAMPGMSASNSETRIVVRSANGVPTSVDRELLLAEVGRIFADSLARALLHMDSAMMRLPQAARVDVPRAPITLTPMMAPPSDGRVRVVVTNYSNATGKREFTGITREVARQVRAALPTDKYDVVSNELTDRAARNMPDRMSVGWGLRADYVVSGMISTRGDSIVVLTLFTDVRDGRFTRMSESLAPVADPRKAYPVAATQVNAWLDTARVSRGRRTRGP